MDLAVVIVQFLTALVTLGTVIWGIQIGRANGVRIEEIHKATNSLTDRLVATTAVAAHAEGKAEGKAEQKRDEKG